MNDYEKLKAIEQVCNLLEKADTEILYRAWLDGSAHELRELLDDRQLSRFRAEGRNHTRRERIREAELDYLRTLVDQLRQDWLHKVYVLSERESEDYNFKRFKDSWNSNREGLLLFLGAGASIGARNSQDEPLASATELRNRIAEKFLPGEPLQEASLEQVASRAEVHADRNSLHKFVEELFKGAKPLWQHAALPFLTPRAVFTTNYDDLIERGWALHSQNADVTPSLGVFDLEQRRWSNEVPIFKPHGSVGIDSKKIGEGGLVLTTFDYFNMLSRNQEMISQFFRQVEDHCVLFIGYSLSDMDIGSHLWNKRRTNQSVNWYAVFPCDDLTREMYADEFGVRVINRKFHEFMKELDDAADFIPPEWKFQEISTLRDKGLIG